MEIKPRRFSLLLQTLRHLKTNNRIAGPLPLGHSLDQRTFIAGNH
jgi:hypothetical protein